LSGAKTEADTITKLLVRRLHESGNRKVAMRSKEFGIWRTYTWKDSYDNVKYIALALKEMGFKRGDKLAILGDNNPQWYWLEWAAQAVGGAAVGIFVDSVMDEVKYIVSHSDAVMVAARDQEQVDKIMAMKEDLPNVKKVIYWDNKGMSKYEDIVLVSLDKLIELGKKYDQSNPDVFEIEVEKGSGEDLATICYTSGTTGLPKGAMVSHRALISATESGSLRSGAKASDEYVAFSPPAWILDQCNGITAGPLIGNSVNFPEEPESIQADIREIGPTSLMYGSRQWESLASQAQLKMSDAPFTKRVFYNLFLPVGYRAADDYYQRKELNPFWKALYKVADWIVFRALRDKMGLLKTTSAMAGGTYVGPDTLRYFAAINVMVKNGYGSTEAPTISLQAADDMKLGSAGTPTSGKEVRIKDEELLVRGSNLFSGYYKNPEATNEKMIGGWLHTEDSCYIDEDGHIFFIERVKDLMKLASGQKFSPTYIESQLKFSPYIRDAMVIGDETKPYVTCIVDIDYESIGKWAERRRIPYTTFTDLSQKTEVCELVRQGIIRVNKSVPPQARIKVFVNLYKEFDADEAELTRTRKLRRSFMLQRYGSLINAMYQGNDKVEMEGEVKYRDGKTAKISTLIKVTKVEGKMAK